MLIGCDVDGVIADLHTEWLSRYNVDWDDTLTSDQITAWEIHRFVKPACGKHIYDYLSDPDLYAHVQPIRDAQWGVAQLRERGHRVVFVTSNTKCMTDQKWYWLEHHGFLTPGQTTPDLVCATDKSLIATDVMIEDYHENQRTSRAACRILLSQPWNADATGPWDRVSTWPEIVGHITMYDFWRERFRV